MTLNPTIDIAGRRIGPGYPCFVIAEAGVNHDGDTELARQLVDAALTAGADAVKFQTFRAERLATAAAPKAEYQRTTTPSGESQQQMLRRLELAPAAHRDLMAHAAARGITFLSSPFDEESADFLAAAGVPAIKVPSGELTNLPLLRHVARLKLPLIVSTGMATLTEVEIALDAIAGAGDPPVAVLHCVSAYPADPSEVNLLAIRTLATACGVPVGFSDHTVGIDIAIAAVAMGACILEKHLTLSRTRGGPDHSASLEPQEFAAMLRAIRRVETAQGDGEKRPTPGELPIAAVVRRSLVAARDIAQGAVVTDDAVAMRRPGTGMPPALREAVVGRRASVAIRAGTLFAPDMLA